MSIAILYLATFIIFLGLDYIGLSYLIRPIFERDVGHLLAEDLRILPTFLFYAFYIVGVLWFVSVPAMNQDKSHIWVFCSAAFLGALAYGTYEFTNLATLRGWSWNMVIADLSWGMVLTGISATSGVAIARSLT